MTDGHGWIHQTQETRDYEKESKVGLPVPDDFNKNWPVDYIMQMYGVHHQTAMRWLRFANKIPEAPKVTEKLYKEPVKKIPMENTLFEQAAKIYQKRNVMEDVCKDLGLSKRTATSRVHNWYNRQGMVMPAQNLTIKAVELAREGASLRFIAEKICLSKSKVEAILKKYSENCCEMFDCLLDKKMNV
jgi:transposase